MVAVRKRIRVNGVLYEEVSRSRRLTEAEARPFEWIDYKSFDLEDLPDGSKPRIYRSPGDWEPWADAAELAIGGTEYAAYASDDDDEDEDDFEPEEPTVFIGFCWIEDDECGAYLLFFDQDEAEEVFSKMLRDVDRMKPREFVKKYHMDIGYE